MMSESYSYEVIFVDLIHRTTFSDLAIQKYLNVYYYNMYYTYKYALQI